MASVPTVVFLPVDAPGFARGTGWWHALGVPHRHLGTHDIATFDKQRFTPERHRGLIGAHYTEHTDDPR